MRIVSKLPSVGTSIFAGMSALAQAYQAVNLSQGFPNFEGDPRLRALMEHYLAAGFRYNQYAPMPGIPELRTVIAQKIKRLYGVDYHAGDEITVTAGATQALSCAILALVRPGDEVVLIEPAYDSYRPFVELAGGRAVAYELRAPDWKLDPQALGALLNERTRLLIVNTPHNPTGSLLDDADMRSIARLLEGTNIALLSDEVYEHMTFDGAPHCSALSYPELRSRTLAVFSFGKTLHQTGWKVGYVVGEGALMAEFRKVHQFNVFAVNTPAQYAIADYLQDERVYTQLPEFFQSKRDLWLRLSAALPLRNLKCQGTYFQVVEYGHLSTEADVDFARRLVVECGVALIPLSVFYSSGLDQKLLRVCFAKTNPTLQEGAERLAGLGRLFGKA